MQKTNIVLCINVPSGQLPLSCNCQANSFHHLNHLGSSEIATHIHCAIYSVYTPLIGSATQPNRMSQGAMINIQMIPIYGYAVKIITAQN